MQKVILRMANTQKLKLMDPTRLRIDGLKIAYVRIYVDPLDKR